MESFISATWAEPRTPGSMVFQDSLSMPSLRWALKWPSVQRGAAAKAVVSLAKAFLAAAMVSRSRRRRAVVFWFTARACEASRSCGGQQAKCSRGDADASDRVALAGSYVGCEKGDSTRASRMQLISATQALRLLASVLQYASYYFLPVSPRVERKRGT